MRTPIVILAGTLLVACASGTRVVYVPVSASTPAPAPAAPPPARVIPAPAPPVGVTIVRVDNAQMLVSTNQPAYLAVFEIVPNRGLTLVYPASAQQRQVALAGSNWLNVSWRSARGLADYDDRQMRGRRQPPPPAHHVYVVASERPLRLTASAFDDQALGAMLGARLTQAADPYETMAALSRRFVPPGKDEDWGEDVYTMDVARPVTTVRVAKIYCPDGSVVYSRDEMADRTVCPWRGQGRNVPAPRPDSVVASNGRRMPRPVEPGPTRVFRVPTPANAPDTRPGNGGEVADGRPGNGTGAANGNGGRDANDDSPRGRENPKGNNGNHYGWGNGNGNDGKDKHTGGTVASGGNANGNDGKDNGNNGNHYGQEKNGNNGNNGNSASSGNANNGNASNGNNGNHYGQEKNGNNGNANNGNTQAEVQQQGKPERPSQAQPNEPKPADVKPEAKPAPEPVAKDEPKQGPKPEAKQEPKPENKGIRGMMDRMRAKSDSSDAKEKKGKP